MNLKFTDQQYLTQDQYKDSSNLDARIVFIKGLAQIHKVGLTGFLIRLSNCL